MQSITANPKSLKPNPWNSNRVGLENMAKLKASIAELGFVSVVVCRELPNGDLQILGGHHRVEAAVELGLKEVPVLNLGVISDSQARKIGLVDNSRYGVDDTIALAKVYEEIGLSSDALAKFLPFTEADFDTIKRTVDINLDELDDFLIDENEEAMEPEDVRAPKPQKTHDLLRFRVALGDKERIDQLIEKTIKREGFGDEDDATAAGLALAVLLFK